MMKSNSVSRQRAISFCIYMMVAGNFEGCRVINPYLEKKFNIEYRCQKTTDQEKFENAAAKLADKFFLRTLPERIWKENPRVLFEINEKTNAGEVTFIGKSWRLRIVGLPRGNKKSPKFLYSFTESISDEKKPLKNAA